MKFLSHGPEDKKDLNEHLIYVATNAEKLATESTFSNTEIAYYAGLYHDLGKLNPYYQKIFCGDPKEIAAQQYGAFHSPYSGWIAKHLLKQLKIDEQIRHRICMIVYGHHGKLRRNTPEMIEMVKEKTMIEPIKNWCDFKQQVPKDIASKMPDVTLNPKRFDYTDAIKLLNGEDGIETFLQCNYFFSCVLQADRSSFAEFNIKKISEKFRLDTDKLNKKSDLESFRSAFQNNVQNNIDLSAPIQIISAPTGAGKTKAFLDLIKKYNSERVYYFSPLLALTDDISEKIKDITDSEQILVYNHIYSGSLENKDDETNKAYTSWNFDHEAFNEKFVITTTNRLLRSIYSNRVKDKLKFASFRNSLLIIDEVQTLPKFLLHNLISILQIMSQKMGTKTLLVSATIPTELSDIPTIMMPNDIQIDYMKKKERMVHLRDELDFGAIQKNSMIMLNTRKKASDTYLQLAQMYDPDVKYISSGITKKQREIIIKEAKNNKKSILVTTQTLEAGVDISFDQIWRQMAPLDNIIQVLGRLDREAINNKSQAFIFDVNKITATPYDELEYIESQKILQEISEQNSTTTISLYQSLPKYYKTISDKNQKQKNKEDRLEDRINNLDFEEVWEIIKQTLGEQYYDSVYIPESESWEQCKEDLLSENKSRIKQHAKIIASLPKRAYDLLDFWDETLYDNGILLPKKDKLDEIYDKEIGLDKWITRQ